MAQFNGKYQNDVCLATISEIFAFEIFDLEKLGQSNGVRHSQWSHSMVIINLYKVIPEHLLLALTVFEIFSHFQFRDLENVGQGHDEQHLHWHHSITNT